MLKRQLLTASITGIFLAIIISCSGKNDQSSAPAEILPDDIVEMRADQAALAKLETDSITVRDLYRAVSVNGKVTVPPQDYATVSAPMGGFIIYTGMLPGEFVKKGQKLATVENQEFVDIQQNYLESKNRLDYAEAEYNRHTESYKEDVYSQMNVQQVTADFKSLKAHVSALEQKLELIGLDPSKVNEANITRSVAILSPISGYIKSVNANTGKSISPTDVLFEIVSTDKLLLELTLFEKDINLVSRGQRVSFFINNEPDPHDATIYQTASAVDADRTFRVYATVSSTCKNLIPGMYVNAVIQTSEKRATALPSAAIVSFDDRNYIFVYVRDKTENGNSFTEYRMVEVTGGISEGGYTEVILPAGFDIKGSKVVVKGAYDLLSAKKNAGEMAC